MTAQDEPLPRATPGGARPGAGHYRPTRSVLQLDENMSLTPKQERFAKCIADGMTQADAYRTAYDAVRMKPTSIHVNASKLMADANISRRVKEIRGTLEKKALWTREMSVKALVTAYKEGNPGVKVSAVKELNAMHGFNAPQRVEVSGTDGGPIEVQTIDTSKLSTAALEEIMAAHDEASR